MRYCYNCKLTQSEDNFTPSHKKLKGKDSRAVGRCKSCVAIRNKAYRKKYPDKLKVYEETRRNSPHRKELYRKVAIKRKYGMLPVDYDKMRIEQAYCCAICGRSEEEHKLSRWGNLCIDHDHETGKVRGLLCATCNKGLGCFKDNIPYMEAALEYLKRNKDK